MRSDARRRAPARARSPAESPARRPGTVRAGSSRASSADHKQDDAPTAARYLTELQQAAGNHAVAQLVATYAGSGSGATVSLHGTTHGEFDGGTSRVSGIRATRATGCECTGDETCYQVSGTLTIRYHVNPVIEMPDVPGGLTPCQERRVRDFLRNVLLPHEREHARRLRTYDGTTVNRFSAKGCGREAAREAAQQRAQEIHDTEAEARAQAADAHSLAIDPFHRPIDLDCEDS